MHAKFSSRKLWLFIGKNLNPTLAKDSAKIEYISGGQPSSYELAFGVELGQNPHSKMVSKSILDPFKGLLTMLSTHQAQKCWTWEDVLEKIQGLHWLEIGAKIEYISEG